MVRYGASTGVTFLLGPIVALEPVDKKLDVEIQTSAVRLPAYPFALPGVTELTRVSLYGEVDPIETFERPSQLAAFAGLDPRVLQSGQYDAPRRHASKRGSPYLRRTLWQMACQAVYNEGDLPDFRQRRHRQNKHHLVALTGVASNLCHVVRQIMTEPGD